ncbi:MAG: hypothetical protein ACRDGT_11185 [Candidatus Limnocylindria bacterium]
MNSRTTYQLWHVPTGNAMSEFDSLDKAVDALRELLDEEGESAVTAIVLFKVDARGDMWPVADGAELLSMIMEKAPQR